MDIGKIIIELRTEHAQICEIIASVERLAVSAGKRRGRPPKWLSDAKSLSGSIRRGRPPGSRNKLKTAV